MMCLVVKSNDNVFYDVGGMDRKGRVFGLGSEIGKYKPSSSILFDGFSSHVYEKMKSQLSNLTKENKNMKEEHEMELQLLNQNEETDKRKRSIALKASSSIQEEEEEDEESEDEEDFSLFVKKFHKFVKKRRIERRQNFNHGKRFQEDSPTLRCYKCNQLGHIKVNCPSNE
ncbi:hypothetical protein D0Y65_000755 [Glycine soja]|uniref:CCHC-type domain-containing protein n=1 Tax=Glycine soja TaxID=3848 RepID=A0A445M050_GLYSO|nr:hypothetical protein D0Y65_000755 [Glycine soja]